jgi:hypothetical protein
MFAAYVHGCASDVRGCALTGTRTAPVPVRTRAARPRLPLVAPCARARALLVTARTVEGHLTQVYRKLEMEARQDLRRALG